jgi:hypothetical protein
MLTLSRYAEAEGARKYAEAIGSLSIIIKGNYEQNFLIAR